MNPAFAPRFLLRPLASALALLSMAAHADVPAVPNSGTLLQQVQPPTPPVPQPDRAPLQVQPDTAAPATASAPFTVQAIRIEGNTAFPTPTLHALVADLEGRTLTLPQLQQAAQRITEFYRAHGFPLSRAIVPAQTIAAGSVRIQVLEARYGAVRLDNGSRVSDALVAATAAPLQPGQGIAERELDRSLLLLSDIPGVAVNAVLKPGAEVGTSDLDVVTRATSAIAGRVAIDNFGDRYTGRARLGAGVSVFNPLHHGDALDLSALTAGEGMNYGRLAYDVLLDGAGTRAGAAFSGMRYEIGKEFSALGAHGSADVGSAWIKRPLLRSRDANVGAQFGFDRKRLSDRIAITDARIDRHLDNWQLALNGDARDAWLGAGQTAWNLAWTSGRVHFDDPGAAAADAVAAQTSGSFSKWTANLSRTQSLAPRDVLQLNLGAQWANANLDSAEKLTVGGPFSVRAYDVGTVSGDGGHVASLELRHELGRMATGRWQAMAFVDSASVRINRHPWTASDNTATLSGAGVGVSWEGPGLWRASVTVATPIGGVPSSVASPSSVRAWAILSEGF